MDLTAPEVAFASLEASLPEVLKPGDLFVTLGAGSIWHVGENWLSAQEQEK